MTGRLNISSRHLPDLCNIMEHLKSGIHRPSTLLSQQILSRITLQSAVSRSRPECVLCYSKHITVTVHHFRQRS